MIHRLDDRLREEARRYRLVFACPDCASFDPGEPGDDAPRGDPGQRAHGGHTPRCALGYPVAPHLDRALDHRDEIVFCKAFELR